ncbi:MAG: Hsp20/alpha crystallin family protein [Sporichthyaceae bacterium]
MIMRTETFRDLDRVAQQLFSVGTPTNPSTVAMDAYRDGETLVLHFDVPGMEPKDIALDVQRNVLTITGDRRGIAPDHCGYLAAERPRGAFRRQVYLGESLDTDRIEAACANGVLTVRIPVADRAKPRRVDIAAGASAPSVEAPEPALN